MTNALSDRAADLQQQALDLARELIRTPSLSGREEAAARLTAQRLRDFGYGDVAVDQVGNALGVLRGADLGPTILFCAHLDCVDPGDRGAWQADPYGGEVAGGYLHGRGASDAKGALAAQLVAGRLLQQGGAVHRGALVVAGVALSEEGNSLGMRHLCDVTLPGLGLDPDLVVVGDPTGLDVYLGHRGRAQLEITTYGRTCEASAPWLGLNAAYKMLPVLHAIKELDTILPTHPFLERSTIALTDVRCLPGRPEVVPDRCVATVDRRFLPTEPVDEVLGQLQSILSKLSATDTDFSAAVRVRTAVERAATGFAQTVPRVTMPFLTEVGQPYVQKALLALQALGERPQTGKWYFASIGAYPAAVKKIPTFGYSPGEEKFGRTPQERVALASLARAVAGNAAIYEAVSA